MSELAVIIPSLGRPEALSGLVDNIHATTKMPHRIYLICEAADESYPDVVNRIFPCLKEKYFLCANDDFWFPEDWMAPIKFDKPVIGVNNGRGNTTTIHLVETGYVRTQGGTVDQGKNIVFYPYNHQFTDTEFHETAEFRGVLSEQPECVILHNHPSFGTRDEDKTDDRKKVGWHDDYETFQRRQKLWNAA